MPKIIVDFDFIGTPQEVEEYGGQTPSYMAHMEDSLTEGERNSFKGKITHGTEMEVTQERALQLAKQGIIKSVEQIEPEAAKEKAEPEKKGEKVLTSEVKKAETEDIPTAKKKGK